MVLQSSKDETAGISNPTTPQSSSPVVKNYNEGITFTPLSKIPYKTVGFNEKQKHFNRYVT